MQLSIVLASALALRSLASVQPVNLEFDAASGQAEKDAAKREWMFRRAMDRVYQDASARSAR